MSIDNASPNDWDKARKEYISSIWDMTDDDSVRQEWASNIRTDVVNKPSHYNQGGIECIDYIEQQLGEGFIEYCEGNVHKYLHRWRYKNGDEDLRKALWYLERMLTKVEEVGL